MDGPDGAPRAAGAKDGVDHCHFAVGVVRAEAAGDGVRIPIVTLANCPRTLFALMMVMLPPV